MRRVKVMEVRRAGHKTCTTFPAMTLCQDTHLIHFYHRFLSCRTTGCGWFERIQQRQRQRRRQRRRMRRQTGQRWRRSRWDSCSWAWEARSPWGRASCRPQWLDSSFPEAYCWPRSSSAPNLLKEFFSRVWWSCTNQKIKARGVRQRHATISTSQHTRWLPDQAAAAAAGDESQLRTPTGTMTSIELIKFLFFVWHIGIICV